MLGMPRRRVDRLLQIETGMDVTQDMFAQLHKNEMVLPAPLSQGFKSIIGSMGPSGAPGAPGGAGSDGGGGSAGTTHNYGGVHVNAFDAKGVADMIQRNQGHFTRAAAGVVRNGWRGR